MKATLLRRRPHSNDVVSFDFAIERPLRYDAGQFTELTLPHPDPDNRGTKRWFTLSSAPNEPHVSITSTFAGTPSSSFKQALQQLQPGQTVDLAEPMGDFVLPKQTDTPLLFIAGGIGMTPYYSMLKWLAARAETRPITLVWGVRTEDNILFQDEVAAAGVRATIIVEQPSAAWGGERGQLSTETILALQAPSPDSLVYLSGPEAMLTSLQTGLQNHGVQRHQLVTDFFPGYDQA